MFPTSSKLRSHLSVAPLSFLGPFRQHVHRRPGGLSAHPGTGCGPAGKARSAAAGPRESRCVETGAEKNDAAEVIRLIAERFRCEDLTVTTDVSRELSRWQSRPKRSSRSCPTLWTMPGNMPVMECMSIFLHGQSIVQEKHAWELMCEMTEKAFQNPMHQGFLRRSLPQRGSQAAPVLGCPLCRRLWLRTTGPLRWSRLIQGPYSESCCQSLNDRKRLTAEHAETAEKEKSNTFQSDGWTTNRTAVPNSQLRRCGDPASRGNRILPGYAAFDRSYAAAHHPYDGVTSLRLPSERKAHSCGSVSAQLPPPAA